MKDPRSRIPSVDRLIEDQDVRSLIEEHGRARVVEAIRAAIDVVRGRISEAERSGSTDEWEDKVEQAGTYAELARFSLRQSAIPSLRPVINATGVVLHTNLGRAPLARAAVEAMQAAAGEYTNLEFDLESGVRGSRYSHCVSLLTELTRCEDALVVNNAAGALVLALNTVGRSEGVAVSRGELVEIGGGFRIPEVLERAGALLVEVGSTNRTRLSDYAGPLEEGEARAVLKVHRSNFRMTGFTEEASVSALADLAREHGAPFIHDLGSGLMVDAHDLGLPEEPRATDSLAAQADVVVVSGDKLLGGPQAGIVLGRADLLDAMRKNPLCRALRVDKVTLAGLEATLRLYRDPPLAMREIPVLRMLADDVTALEARARALQSRLSEAGVTCEVVESKGAVGGGTFPGVELPAWAVDVRPPNGGDELSAALRGGTPPVVGRLVDGVLRLDVRTVLPGQEDDLVRRLVEAVTDLPS